MQINSTQLKNEHGVRGTKKNVIVRKFLESNGTDISKFKGKSSFSQKDLKDVR